MTRRVVVAGMATTVLAAVVWAAIWGRALWHEAPSSNAGPAPSENHPLHQGEALPQQPSQDHRPSSRADEIFIAPERLQSIGVTFEVAKRRPVERLVRTVGRVEMDERRIARVNLKFEGWIEDPRVSAVGDHVKKDDILFTIYSPELVATQEEYLLALQGVKDLGASEFPEVARGAKDLLEAARRRFALWDVPAYHLRELEDTGNVLRTLPVHAPITGTVIYMQARAGTYVTPGTELYLIADLSRVWILADIYEYELTHIQVGQEATVTLAYDPSFRQQAHVGFVYPTLDPKTRTAKVRFELENPNERLKPDMYANVQLTMPLGTRLVVPRDAILDTGERQIIFVHHGGGTLEWRTVQVGVQAEGVVEVVQGVQEGDHVVTSANFLIDSESQLQAAIRGMGSMQH